MTRPPRLPGVLVRLLLPSNLAERILGDLDEEWIEHVRPARGPFAAGFWYWKLALGSLVSVGWGRLKGGPGVQPRAAWVAPFSGGRGRTVGWWYDGKMAARSLARSPGLTAAAISVSALGIAAATVVFSVADHVFLKPLPYGEADRLVAVQGVQLRTGAGSGNTSYPNLRDLSIRAGALEGVVGASWWRTAFTEQGRGEVVWGLTVSWDYFRVLGIDPAAGRFFGEDEEGEGRPPVIVLSHDIWQTRFGGDPEVVGTAALLTGLAYQVVGVTPPGFRDPMGVSSGVDIGVWRTPGFNAPDGFRSGRSWVGFGRLAGGTTLDRSASELTTLGEDLAAEWPEENTDRGFRPVPIRVWLTGPVRTTVLTLAGSVLVILLVACANIANLLLARALQKQRELAVRVALGASGGRLLRASMAEALVLSAAGGIVGAALAFAGLDAVVALAGGWIPQLEDASVDGRMLGFAALAAAVTGLTFGTIPGLRARSAAAAGWARGGGDGQGESRLRRGLVVLEVASAVVLLFGAGLFVRTFVALQQEELGIDTEGLVSMEMSDAGWVDLNEEAGAARWDEILAAVGAVPGVSAVGAIDIVPLEDSYSCDGTRRLDLPPPGPGEGMCTEVRAFLPGAFEAMGIGLVDGRRPDGRDRALGERSVWLSEEAVERLWPERGVRPLGSRLQIHSEEFVVAGIVTDVRHFGPARPVQPMVYLPAHQEPWNGVSRGLALVASIDGSVGDAIGRIRSAVSAAAPGVPVGDVRSGAQLAAGRVAAPRFRLALAVGFATATLVIALVGLGGLTSFSVSRRRREIGVRKALGARSHEIRRMVLLESFGLLGLGLLLGVAAALPLGFALSRFLHSVRPWDPVTLAGVALFMAVAVAAASYPSALRAAREDPADALRTGESSA